MKTLQQVHLICLLEKCTAMWKVLYGKRGMEGWIDARGKFQRPLMRCRSDADADA